jgi:hypothetical protein
MYRVTFKKHHDECRSTLCASNKGLHAYASRKDTKKYIIQRYTLSAQQDVSFERIDRSFKGRDGVTRSYR